MDVVKKVFFTKMHGLGNDFVIIDRRKYSFSFDNNAIKKLSNRRTGIGFDQLILISQCNDGVADIKISIFNSDASEAESCGNASRCVGKMLMKEFRTKNLILETKGGLVDIEEEEDGMISVDMGLVKFNWDEIPLTHPVDTNNLGLKLLKISDGFVVNVGNPHIVFFCNNFIKKEIEKDCISVSKMKIFPQGVNISIATVISKNIIDLQVYERGCGFTSSCGTGACATLIAASKLGLTEEKATVKMVGGELEISYLKDNHVIMKGPVSSVYTGEIIIDDFIKN